MELFKTIAAGFVVLLVLCAAIWLVIWAIGPTGIVIILALGCVLLLSYTLGLTFRSGSR